jgi:cytochrome c-type biogenesis protein
MSLEQWFTQSLNAQSASLIVLAFAGGVVSTLLPCSISMLPVLVGYVGGYAETNTKADILLQVGLFVTGLAFVMTLLGLSAGFIGVTFGTWAGSGWYYAVGALAIAMGLQLLDVIHLPLPRFITRLPEGGIGKTGAAKYFAPVILGMAFGAASSPCGTPFLAGIMALISNTKNIVLGGTSLFAYALGQGSLLVVVGLFTGLLKHRARMQQVGSVITKLSAALFMIVGLLLFAEGSGILADILIQLRLL